MNSEYSYSVNTFDTGHVSSYVGHMFSGARSPWMLILALVGASAVVTVALIGLILHFFVGNVLEVGARSFYIDNLFSKPGPEKIFSAFRSGIMEMQ